MSNYEYANATDAELAQWEEAAYQAQKEAQDEAYDVSVRAYYAALGMSNIY